MSEEMQSVGRVEGNGDGLCEACRDGNVQLPIERPRVTYRPFTDEDRAKAAADVERWEREGLLEYEEEGR